MPRNIGSKRCWAKSDPMGVAPCSASRKCRRTANGTTCRWSTTTSAGSRGSAVESDAEALQVTTISLTMAAARTRMIHCSETRTPTLSRPPGEPPGRWFGTGAAALGLSGIVREEQYHRVFRGFHPVTEKALVQNAGKPKRRPGWEACFSAPKAVSVLWSQMTPADRERLQAVNWRAVENTIRMIEERFAFSRAGKASEGCWLRSGGAGSRHVRARQFACQRP